MEKHTEKIIILLIIILASISLFVFGLCIFQTDEESSLFVKNASSITPSTSGTSSYVDMTIDNAGGTTNSYNTKLRAKSNGNIIIMGGTREIHEVPIEGPGSSTSSFVVKSTKTGYRFLGYYANNGKQIITANGCVVDNTIADYCLSNNITRLTAEWQETDLTTITIDKNGGDTVTDPYSSLSIGNISGNFYSSNRGSLSLTSTVGIPTRTGYEFTGYKDSNGTLIANRNGVLQTLSGTNLSNFLDNPTIIAQWEAVATPNVSLDKTSIELYVGETSTLTAINFDGNTMGWYIRPTR